MGNMLTTGRPTVRRRAFAVVGSPSSFRADGTVLSHGSWRWLFSNEPGIVVAGPAVAFTSQQSAENWLAGAAPSLRKLGITRGTLVDGERVVPGQVRLGD